MTTARPTTALTLLLIAVAAACDARPQQGAAELAPDTLAAVVPDSATVELDSVAALDSIELPPEPPAEDAVITPGAAVGPDDFRVGVTPIDPARRVPRPDTVRALYVNAWSAASNARLTSLIGIADRTEINAFVVDIKEADGQVTYRSSIPMVRRVGANTMLPVADMRAVLGRLREHGIYPIARIVIFKDPVLAAARPDWAIQTADQRIWRDQHGTMWVDSYNRNVWDYNIALAREAIALGFSEVQWDYVRFPDVPAAYMRTAVHPAREGRSKAQAIRQFLQYSNERLGDLDVPITADVFGVTTSASGDVGIGQHWESMTDVVDVLLPMVYPSHYPRGSFGIAHPNADPYRTILTALRHGVRRNRAVEDAALIRPWLQDFTLGNPPYGAAHVRAQIQAVYDAGLTEWVLWNASSRYTPAALADAHGRVPHIEGLAALLATPSAPPQVSDSTPSTEKAGPSEAEGHPDLLGTPKTP